MKISTFMAAALSLIALPVLAETDCIDTLYSVASAVECAQACQAELAACCGTAPYSCVDADYYAAGESCTCISHCNQSTRCGGGGGGGGGGGPAFECDADIDCWPEYGVGATCELRPWGSECVPPDGGIGPV